jgi:putative hemolysin
MAQKEAAMRTFRSLGWGGALALLLLSGLLAACGVPNQADQPGPAQIDEVTVQMLESFPVQVEVLIRGSLPNSCTQIDKLDQRFDPEENIFWIEITTVRTTDDACAQALVPFEDTVPLDVYGLPAGTYTVDVNGKRETFTLEVDNEPAGAGLPNPASFYCEEQGYRVEIRTDDDGSQHGICIFPDGSECDESAFFRGECGPAD